MWGLLVCLLYTIMESHGNGSKLNTYKITIIPQRSAEIHRVFVGVNIFFDINKTQRLWVLIHTQLIGSRGLGHPRRGPRAKSAGRAAMRDDGAQRGRSGRCLNLCSFRENFQLGDPGGPRTCWWVVYSCLLCRFDDVLRQKQPLNCFSFGWVPRGRARKLASWSWICFINELGADWMQLPWTCMSNWFCKLVRPKTLVLDPLLSCPFLTLPVPSKGKERHQDLKLKKPCQLKAIFLGTTVTRLSGLCSFPFLSFPHHPR